MRNVLKIVAASAGFSGVVLLTGFDSPECNFWMQAIAVLTCFILCLLCGIIIYGKED